MWRRVSRPTGVRVSGLFEVLLPVIALGLVGFAVLLDGAAGPSGRVAAQKARNMGYAPAPEGCGWQLVPSANQETYNRLNAVAALSANDIWAVGGQGTGFAGQRTIIEHWDGSSWSILPSPNPGAVLNELHDVAALSPNDVWAVGFHSSGSINSGAHTFVLHWDGTAWSQVPSPDVGTFQNELHGMVALSANDIWAVGHTWISGGRHTTMVLHWDGTAWSVVPSPNVGTQDNHLKAVVSVSANDLWAVGEYMTDGGLRRTLIQHWDGVAWTIVPTPNAPQVNNFLTSVAPVSAVDIWAVGYYCPGNCLGTNAREALTLHWDGSLWSIVPHPNVGTVETILEDVVALAADNVWIAGHYDSSSPRGTLTSHWDGSAWSVVPSANPQSCCPELHGITALSRSEIWAVGHYHFSGNPVFRTLVERYDDTCVPATVTPEPTTATTATSTLTPSHTPTNLPPATATHTRTAAPTYTITSSPTRTVTPCLISFFDVHPADYFYEAVIYLACHGALSGYSDGTFRPYNNTTRGQMTKIVVLAFDYEIYTPPTPTFTDVPTTDPFYLYIETAAHNQIVSGYSDGTFRPFNNVTRGQLCKIVVSAAGWPLLNPPTPSFRDVPREHPFYTHVETAYNRGIISGYSDSTFRPYNNATRGQISKIVYQATIQP